MTPSRRRIVADIVLNLINVLSVFVAVGWYFWGDFGVDILGSFGFASFRYFTTDSNLLAAVSCVIWAVYQVKRLKHPQLLIPGWVRVLRLMSVTAVTITLLTVALFLAPMAAANSPAGWGVVLFFYETNVFVLHLTSPLICIVSFLLNDAGHPFPWKKSLWALIPMVVYETFYILFVAVLKEWPDFYGFTFGGSAAASVLSCAVMTLFAFAVASVLRLLQNRILHRA